MLKKVKDWLKPDSARARDGQFSLHTAVPIQSGLTCQHTQVLAYTTLVLRLWASIEQTLPFGPYEVVIA